MKSSISQSLVFVELKYPYGKARVFQSGSLIAIAARFITLGYNVTVLDFNIHAETSDFAQNILANASHVCISMTGTPYIPDAIVFAKKMTLTGIPVVIGGQGAETLSQYQFDTLFFGTNAVRIGKESDLMDLFPIITKDSPSVFNVPYAQVWETLDEKSIQTYLTNEMTLVISQGCIHQCTFCAAKKKMAESFRDLSHFESDLRYIAYQAKKRGISKINFYASSLDFFQSAIFKRADGVVIEVEEVLQCMARVRKETGVDIKTRCLSTMKSFLTACERIPNLGQLLNEAGLYRIGFGVDGSDPLIWKSQKKNHNKQYDDILCIEQTSKYDICSEILMVVGFPQDTLKTLALNVFSAFRYSKHKNVILRAYMAKSIAPGNDGWNEEAAQPFLDDPTRFHQIDYCAFANRTTHPIFWHRFMSNICYGILMILFSFSGRSVTYPVFPIRGSIIKRTVARWLNDQMPGVD